MKNEREIMSGREFGRNVEKGERLEADVKK